MDIDTLLAHSVKNQASDLHILPGVQPLVRIDGFLAPIKGTAVLSAQDTMKFVCSVLTPEQQTLFKEQLVLEFAYSTAFGHFRVSAFHQMHGVGAVFRVVPATVPAFEDLVGLPPVLKTLLNASRGLILAAGPTGSGKSTTLAAMVDYINTHRVCHVITIEDPIEFIHQNKRSILNQIQVGRDTKDFATALRASLRQDPNVILLGELRDLETMRLALTAVETGHLVLATIHATSAPLAINRFADVFPSEEKNRVRTLLSETLEAVVCQRLLKRKSSSGRIAVFELLLSTPAIKNYIRQDMPAHMESAMQTGGDKGMMTFETSIQHLLKDNLITELTAETVMTELKSFSGSSKDPSLPGQ
jgi:twitching motility protein PilT